MSLEAGQIYTKLTMDSRPFEESIKNSVGSVDKLKDAITAKNEALEETMKSSIQSVEDLREAIEAKNEAIKSSNEAMENLTGMTGASNRELVALTQVARQFGVTFPNSMTQATNSIGGLNNAIGQAINLQRTLNSLKMLTPKGMAMTLLSGTVAFASRIISDAEERGEALLNEAERKYDAFFLAMEYAQRGQLANLEQFNEAQQRALQLTYERARAEEAVRKETEKHIAASARAVASARDLIDLVNTPPTNSLMHIVNLRALEDAEAELSKMLEHAASLDHSVKENADSWRYLFNTLQEVQGKLRDLADIDVYAPRTIDFSDYTNNLDSFKREIQDQLSSAVENGMNPQRAYEVFSAEMNKKIGSISRSMRETLGGAWAASWEDSARRSFGLDETSRELRRFRQETERAAHEIQRYQEFLRQTGNTSDFARQQLGRMTEEFTRQRFAQLDPIQRQKVIDELERLGQTAGGQYARALAEQLKGGTRDAIEDAQAAIRSISTEDFENAFVRAINRATRQDAPLVDPESLRGLRELEIEIDGAMRRISGREARMLNEGGRNAERVMDSLRTRFKYEDRAAEQIAEKQRARWREENEWRKRAGLELVGPSEYWPDEELPPDVAISLLSSLLPAAKEIGAEAWEQFNYSFSQAAMNIEPPTMPVPQIDIDAFGRGVVDQMNTIAPSVSASITSMFSGISFQLEPLGKEAGQAFAEGIRRGFNPSGLASDIYDVLMRRFRSEIAAAGGG